MAAPPSPKRRPCAPLPASSFAAAAPATDQVKIRLVPVGDDVEIATWTDEDVLRVLASAPAFATQLGALADHIQVRVGVALGPLGERLDFALRTEIVDRLETRHLKEGDVVVAAGKPVPGMIVVGAGSLELVDGPPPPCRTSTRASSSSPRRSSGAARRRTPRAPDGEGRPSSSADASSRRSSW